MLFRGGLFEDAVAGVVLGPEVVEVAGVVCRPGDGVSLSLMMAESSIAKWSSSLMVASCTRVGR